MSPDAPALYELTNLVRTRGGRTVLSVDSLRVEPGEMVGVVGPNGAGKTTLLNILAFLDFPTRGGLSFSGRRVFPGGGLGALRRQAVLIHQHPVMFSGTVQKNLEFGLKVRKVPRAERKRIVSRSLELVGMEAFARARAGGLSGGETQRVAIARAVALSPRVMLCDEPTSGVDAEARDAVARLLLTVNREQGVTVIFSSHDASWARSLAARTLRLHEGRLVSSRYENLYTGTVEPDPATGQSVLVTLSGARLPAPTLPPGPARVAVDPAGVVLHKEPKGRLAGVVKEVGLENGGVRLLVDAGVPVHAAMDLAAYREAGILAGDRVGVEFSEMRRLDRP
ncbi:MAG: ATP-binding cassette domain-containing protein [Deltaproteobacteria bacterium]|nr:ATP-binding cassette domain-containing protein [Deltaproteobacteria bacterium]